MFLKPSFPEFPTGFLLEMKCTQHPLPTVFASAPGPRFVMRRRHTTTTAQEKLGVLENVFQIWKSGKSKGFVLRVEFMLFFSIVFVLLLPRTVIVSCWHPTMFDLRAVSPAGPGSSAFLSFKTVETVTATDLCCTLSISWHLTLIYLAPLGLVLGFTAFNPPSGR